MLGADVEQEELSGLRLPVVAVVMKDAGVGSRAGDRGETPAAAPLAHERGFNDRADLVLVNAGPKRSPCAPLRFDGRANGPLEPLDLGRRLHLTQRVEDERGKPEPQVERAASQALDEEVVRFGRRGPRIERVPRVEEELGRLGAGPDRDPRLRFRQLIPQRRG
jgi:hypothetical protein